MTDFTRRDAIKTGAGLDRASGPSSKFQIVLDGKWREQLSSFGDLSDS